MLAQKLLHARVLVCHVSGDGKSLKRQAKQAIPNLWPEKAGLGQPQLQPCTSTRSYVHCHGPPTVLFHACTSASAQCMRLDHGSQQVNPCPCMRLALGSQPVELCPCMLTGSSLRLARGPHGLESFSSRKLQILGEHIHLPSVGCKTVPMDVAGRGADEKGCECGSIT